MVLDYDAFARYNKGVIYFSLDELDAAAAEFHSPSLMCIARRNCGIAEKAVADMKEISQRGVRLDADMVRGTNL